MPSWKKKISFGLGALLLAATMGAPAYDAQLSDFSVGVNNTPGQPAELAPGGTTSVRITLTNSSTTAALTGVNFSGLAPVTNPANAGNSLVANGSAVISGDGCTGTASVTPAGAISLSGMTIPKQVGSDAGICYIDVPVKAVSVTGTAFGVSWPMPTDGGTVFTGSGDTNGSGSSQGFAVTAVDRPTFSKSFSSTTATLGGGTVNLTLRVTNPANGVPLTGVSFKDVFPVNGAGGAVIEPVSVGTITPAGCVAPSNVALTTGPSAQVALSNMSVAKGGSCEVTVAVRARQTNGEYQLQNQTNTLKASDFTSDQGLAPLANATADITVKSPLEVNKVANPERVASGQVGTFVITLTNTGSTALPVNSFNELNISDTQSGQNLTPSGLTSTCVQTSGQTRTLATTATGFTSSGYDVPANDSCTLTVSFTGTTSDTNQPLTFTNSIPKGAVAITGEPGIISQPRSATVTVIDELFVDKSQSPAKVAPGNPVKYSITVSNFGNTDRNNVRVMDTLQNDSTFLTGTFDDIDRTPTLTSGCGTLGGVPETGETALGFIIPTLPKATATPANTPGQCTITFWALTDPEGNDNTSNRIAACGVWYGDSQVAAQAAKQCNGKASDNVTAEHQKPLVLEKTFNGTNYTTTGITKPEGTVVTMRIRVNNYNDQALKNATVSDTFPNGLQVASPANESSSCGGEITATPGSSSLALNNATLPARNSTNNTPGRCTVQVDVVGPAGSYPNTATTTVSLPLPSVPSKVLTASSNEATLKYESALGADKKFNPTTMTADGKSQVRIRLENTDKTATLTNVAVTDPLDSAKLKLADPANLYTTCGGNPQLSGAPGATSVSLTGVTLPPSSSCDLLFDVVDNGGSGNWVNTIPVGGVTADGGIENVTPVTATLARSGAQAPVVTKTITPGQVAPGQAARLEIRVSNGTQALSGIALTDHFSKDGLAGGELTGMQVAKPANATTTCPGGVVTATPGATQVSLSGASLAANTDADPAVKSCVIAVDVISVNPGAI